MRSKDTTVRNFPILYFGGVTKMEAWNSDPSFQFTWVDATETHLALLEVNTSKTTTKLFKSHGILQPNPFGVQLWALKQL